MIFGNVISLRLDLNRASNVQQMVYMYMFTFILLDQMILFHMFAGSLT